MLVFKKLNDVYLQVVEGERSDEKMLSDWFTFEVEGAKFSPSYKAKYWDGKIRLYDVNKKIIYAGLFQEIMKFSETMDIPVEFEGNRFEIPGIEQPLDDEFAEGFLKALQPHSRGTPIEMRDYQKEAFKVAVKRQRSLLLSPTASGKSLIIYSLIRWYREVHERKILIIVPTVGLVSQMIADFKDYSNGSFTDVQGIQGGTTKDVSSRVVVSTWQSIYQQPLGWFAQFGSVIVDEVHTAQAKSLKGIMEKLLVCPDRIGLTGTLQEAKTNQLVLKGLFGPVKKMISTKELMDRDQIAKMRIKLVQFDYNSTDRKTVSKTDYQSEIDFIINHEQRNQMISRMAADFKGNTLIVFQRIEHGKRLFDSIETDKYKFYIAGETDKDAREAARHFTEENDVIIVASLGVFSTGVNIRNLHNLIFAHPTKSKIKVLQSIGRVLRKANDKDEAIVYDIVDDLKHGQRQNFALRHANERFKQYTNENFDYKLYTVKLK